MTASVREHVHVQLFMTTSINFGLRIITVTRDDHIMRRAIHTFLACLGGESNYYRRVNLKS